MGDLDQRERDFACGFCLEVSTSCVGPPEHCMHCHMAQCTKCETWLKEISPFCYGCGTIKPETRSRMVGTYQTAYIYMQDGWMRRNRGRLSDAVYSIVTGFPKQPSSCSAPSSSSWISKRDGNGNNVDVRELTPEEHDILTTLHLAE